MSEPIFPVPFPASFDAQALLPRLVSWVADLMRERDAPSFIIGLSGTDSILAFLVCAQACAVVGRSTQVVGVHYGQAFPPIGKTAEQVGRMLALNPGMAWFQRSIMPWLAARAPEAQLMVAAPPGTGTDAERWAELVAMSLDGQHAREPLQAVGARWVVGTRNKTEEALFTYSNVSSAVSLQPLSGLWKSEVMSLCTYLGVPAEAMSRSRQADCDCGRFDLAAGHIEEVDAILMSRSGEMDPGWLAAHIETGLLADLQAFVLEQIAAGRFKADIPYRPARELLLGMPGSGI